MARQNYKAEKRRRELEKKRKKEAKREKRLQRAELGSDEAVDTEAGNEQSSEPGEDKDNPDESERL